MDFENSAATEPEIDFKPRTDDESIANAPRSAATEVNVDLKEMPQDANVANVPLSAPSTSSRSNRERRPPSTTLRGTVHAGGGMLKHNLESRKINDNDTFPNGEDVSDSSDEERIQTSNLSSQQPNLATKRKRDRPLSSQKSKKMDSTKSNKHSKLVSGDHSGTRERTASSENDSDSDSSDGSEASDSDDSSDDLEFRKEEIEVAIRDAPARWTERFGDIVWARPRRSDPFWPAYIYDPSNPIILSNDQVHKPKEVGNAYIAYYFGYEFGKINPKQTYGFCKGNAECIVDWSKGLENGLKSQKLSKTLMKELAIGVEQAIATEALPKSERLAWRVLPARPVKPVKLHKAKEIRKPTKDSSNSRSFAKKVKEEKEGSDGEESEEAQMQSSASDDDASSASSSSDSDMPVVQATKDVKTTILKKGMKRLTKSEPVEASNLDSDVPAGSAQTEDKQDKVRPKSKLGTAKKARLDSSGMSEGLAKLAASAVLLSNKASTKDGSPRLTPDDEIRKCVSTLIVASGLQRDKRPDNTVVYKQNLQEFNQAIALAQIESLHRKELSYKDVVRFQIIPVLKELRSVNYFNDDIKQRAGNLFYKWKQQFATEKPILPTIIKSNSSNSLGAASGTTSHESASHINQSPREQTRDGAPSQSRPPSHDAVSTAKAEGQSPRIASQPPVDAPPMPLPNEPWAPKLLPDHIRISNIRTNQVRWMHSNALKSMEAAIRLEEACWQAKVTEKDRAFGSAFAGHVNKYNDAPGNNDNFNGSFNEYIFRCNELGFILANHSYRKLLERIVRKEHKNPVDLKDVVVGRDLQSLCV